jgi:hypothetical protein
VGTEILCWEELHEVSSTGLDGMWRIVGKLVRSGLMEWWMEYGSGWNMGVDGIWEWMEYGSGWNMGVDGIW